MKSRTHNTKYPALNYERKNNTPHDMRDKKENNEDIPA
jgi:hypothetical protein